MFNSLWTYSIIHYNIIQYFSDLILYFSIILINISLWYYSKFLQDLFQSFSYLIVRRFSIPFIEGIFIISFKDFLWCLYQHQFFTSHGRLFRPKMVVTIEVGTPTMPCPTSYFASSLLYPLKNITRSKILEHFLLGRYPTLPRNMWSTDRNVHCLKDK